MFSHYKVGRFWVGAMFYRFDVASERFDVVVRLLMSEVNPLPQCFQILSDGKAIF